MIIFSFGNMGSYRLQIDDSSDGSKAELSSEMLRIDDLLSIYFEVNEIEKTEDCINKLLDTLASLSSLLWDYFSVDIVGDDENVEDEKNTKVILFLRSIPCIINGFAPALEYLPELMYNLGNIKYEDVSLLIK